MRRPTNPTEPEIRRWNLFARKLEEVLSHHGIRLVQLDDHAAIRREKVARLQQSLEVPESFPTLNPDEMSLVIEACHLTVDEESRLLAASIATAVEAMLMTCILSEDAHKAADLILPVIEASRRTYESASYVTPGLLWDQVDLAWFDVEYESALAALDGATIECHLYRFAFSATDGLQHLRQARDGFSKAMDLLTKADPKTRETEAWRLWYEEAQRSYQAVSQRVVYLKGTC